MNKISIKVALAIASFCIIGFMSSKSTHAAYISSSNPVDAENVPTSEINREIVFLDEDLHKELNRRMGRGVNTNPITIRDAQEFSLGSPAGTVSMILVFYNVDNLEGMQYFDFCKGSIETVALFNSSIVDFSPIRCATYNKTMGFQVYANPDLPEKPVVKNFGNVNKIATHIIIDGYDLTSKVTDSLNFDIIERLTINNSNVSDVSFLKNADASRSLKVDVTNSKVSDISVLNDINFLPEGSTYMSRFGFITPVEYSFDFSNNNIREVPSKFYDLNYIDLNLSDNKITKVLPYAEEKYAKMMEDIEQRGEMEYYLSDLEYKNSKLAEYRLLPSQQPDINVDSKVIKNPLEDKNGNPIPIKETNLIKNGKNGTLILLVNDKSGSVSAEWDDMKGFIGVLTINYNLANATGLSRSSELKAPNTGYGSSLLLSVLAAIISAAIIVGVFSKNNIPSKIKF